MLKQKQLMVAAIIIILFVLGLGGFFLFSKQSPSTQNQASNLTAKDQNTTMESLVDLINGGSNVTCSFNSTNEDGYSTSGTVYISSGNMRGEFVNKMEGKTTNMSMIRNGNDNYIWGDDMETGIKMTIPTEELTAKTNESSKYVDLNQKLDYKCSPWGVDQSKFNPPTNIKFTDLSKMMEETTKMMEDNKTGMDSSICDSIEDANAKAACKSAMSQ